MITRHLIAHDGGYVHVRVQKGISALPPLLLIHQSPQNSRAYLPWFTTLGRRSVIAPDLPGFGDSDPLAQPSIGGFAQALVKVMDALAVPTVVAFGTHTGAMVALELLSQAPRRVEGLVCDGLPMFTPEERTEFARHYFPTYHPTADGSHVQALWERLRRQTQYFPWYSDAALGRGPASPEALMDTFCDVVESRGACWDSYAAAMRYNAMPRVATLRVPSVLIYRENDVLASHTTRLPALPPSAQLLSMRDSAQVLAHLASATA